MSERSWLKGKQQAAPAEPPHVDYQNLLIANQGRKSRSVAYILKNGPQQTFDEWGQPLPLSSVGQYDLDRLVAVLKNPITRIRDLMLSGLLNSDEVASVKAVHPDIYDMVTQAAVRDMLETKPPFQIWAQGVLDILFQKPATQMYAEANQADPTKPDQPQGSPTLGMPNALPTPTDRRETAVREQARR